jgi:peptidoglycan/xylan/chitin deacetylase (PgdA/CDA1 family)
MSKPIASLSLDLDNQWSYMKTHGDPGWETYPSYLDIVVPRVLQFCGQRELLMTVFVVGQDAALSENRQALAAIADAGHEIGNHSFRHEPWLHLYSEQQVEDDLATAERHIESATGQRPVGFRGPGFSLSPKVLDCLHRRDYVYDASTFPTYLGPLARAYYFLTARLDQRQKRQRKELFGNFRDGLQPLKPYQWKLTDGSLIEIPVTTMPWIKAPIHVSYLLYLGQFSTRLALSYFRFAIALCRRAGVQPSLLLHPLDFLGIDDDVGLSFFPAMNIASQKKLRLVGNVIDLFCQHFHVMTMLQHAQHVADQSQIPCRDVSTSPRSDAADSDYSEAASGPIVLSQS